MIFKLMIIVFANKGVMKSPGGVWINKRKYRPVRYFEDIDAVYLKGPGGTGGCL